MLALITEGQYEPRSAVVERVIDGGTIEVRVAGQTHTVRLIGADTPETDQRQIEFPQRRLEIPTQGLKQKSCSRPLRRPFPRSSFL